MADLDLDFVRAQFPAFDDPSRTDWVFAENAGGSYPCRHVVERLDDIYRTKKVQPYWTFPMSADLGEMMDESRTRLSAAMGVDPDEIHFGPSTSANTYVLAQAVRQGMSKGEIIVTDQDHEANSGVWRRLAAEGFTLREWRLDPETGRLDPETLEYLISEKTRIVCFPHASNIVAEINPVRQICATIRSAGALSVVDGVSYAPHGIPDVSALGADIYMFSAYKTHGPHQGVLTVRSDAAERLEPQCHGFNRAHPRAWFTPAGPDHAQIAALAGMMDYAEALSAHHGGTSAGSLMRDQEIALTARFMDWLSGRKDLRLLGPSDPHVRAPTIALVHRRPGEDLADALADHRIAAGGGCFYSDRCVAAQGVAVVHGVLRISYLHYNTLDEVDRTIDALERVL